MNTYIVYYLNVGKEQHVANICSICLVFLQSQSCTRTVVDSLSLQGLWDDLPQKNVAQNIRLWPKFSSFASQSSQFLGISPSSSRMKSSRIPRDSRKFLSQENSEPHLASTNCSQTWREDPQNLLQPAKRRFRGTINEHHKVLSNSR